MSEQKVLSLGVAISDTANSTVLLSKTLSTLPILEESLFHKLDEQNNIKADDKVIPELLLSNEENATINEEVLSELEPEKQGNVTDNYQELTELQLCKENIVANDEAPLVPELQQDKEEIITANDELISQLQQEKEVNVTINDEVISELLLEKLHNVLSIIKVLPASELELGTQKFTTANDNELPKFQLREEEIKITHDYKENKVEIYKEKIIVDNKELSKIKRDISINFQITENINMNNLRQNNCETFMENEAAKNTENCIITKVDEEAIKDDRISGYKCLNTKPVDNCSESGEMNQDTHIPFPFSVNQTDKIMQEEQINSHTTLNTDDTYNISEGNQTDCGSYKETNINKQRVHLQVKDYLKTTTKTTLSPEYNMQSNVSQTSNFNYTLEVNPNPRELICNLNVTSNDQPENTVHEEILNTQRNTLMNSLLINENSHTFLEQNIISSKIRDDQSNITFLQGANSWKNQLQIGNLEVNYIKDIKNRMVEEKILSSRNEQITDVQEISKIKYFSQPAMPTHYSWSSTSDDESYEESDAEGSQESETAFTLSEEGISQNSVSSMKQLEYIGAIESQNNLEFFNMPRVSEESENRDEPSRLGNVNFTVHDCEGYTEKKEHTHCSPERNQHLLHSREIEIPQKYDNSAISNDKGISNYVLSDHSSKQEHENCIKINKEMSIQKNVLPFNGSLSERTSEPSLVHVNSESNNSVNELTVLCAREDNKKKVINENQVCQNMNDLPKDQNILFTSSSQFENDNVNNTINNDNANASSAENEKIIYDNSNDDLMAGHGCCQHLKNPQQINCSTNMAHQVPTGWKVEISGMHKIDMKNKETFEFFQDNSSSKNITEKTKSTSSINLCEDNENQHIIPMVEISTLNHDSDGLHEVPVWSSQTVINQNYQSDCNARNQKKINNFNIDEEDINGESSFYFNDPDTSKKQSKVNKDNETLRRETEHIPCPDCETYSILDGIEDAGIMFQHDMFDIHENFNDIQNKQKAYNSKASHEPSDRSSEIINESSFENGLDLEIDYAIEKYKNSNPVPSQEEGNVTVDKKDISVQTNITGQVEICLTNSCRMCYNNTNIHNQNLFLKRNIDALCLEPISSLKKVKYYSKISHLKSDYSAEVISEKEVGLNTNASSFSELDYKERLSTETNKQTLSKFYTQNWNECDQKVPDSSENDFHKDDDIQNEIYSQDPQKVGIYKHSHHFEWSKPCDYKESRTQRSTKRFLRLGLSKRAKPTPLHSTVPLMSSTVCDSTHNINKE